VQLASVEVVPYALPFKEPYVTARGTLPQREMVLLRLRDEDGTVGLGEAVPLSLRGGATLAEVVRELEGFGEHQETEGLSAPARCAVGIALMDMEGRRAGEKEAGKGEGDEAVPCNATLVAGEPKAVAADAEAWAAEGFATFKLKLGAESASTLVPDCVNPYTARVDADSRSWRRGAGSSGAGGAGVGGTDSG
jgi:L-alanine-DL-glutamate epimerase-like enolase superfamily enzyme